MTKADRQFRDTTDYEIRSANVDEVGPLPDIEVIAAAVVPPEDLPPEMRQTGLSRSFFEGAADEGRVWIAVSKSAAIVVGFSVATLVDGSAHLYEIDVLPDHARKGIGAGLVEAVAAWARDQGFPSLTLTTFRHLAWNAPFYQRLGFREVDPSDSPELAQLLVEEAENGLDPTKRVAMRRSLVD